jgi:transcription antitermination factor NusG
MIEKWYAVYTKPRWEKKVAELLTNRNITNYCPLNKVVRQWSDRKKTVYEPLFTSYVFVRVTEKQLHEVKENIGVLNIVYWLGKPALIRDEEIEAIRKFLNQYCNVNLTKPEFRVNDPVKVTRGPLMELEGVVVVIKNNTVKVALPSLGCMMYAEMERGSIEVIENKVTSTGQALHYAY